MAVIVVTHNSQHVIAGLLESLPAALAGLRADVVVVDNASTDGTRKLLQDRDDCLLIRSDNVGYSAAINRGIREARPAEAFLILNPDVRLGPNCVSELVTALRTPGTGITAPQIRSEGDLLDITLRREPTTLRALGLNWTKLPAFSEYLGRPEDYHSARFVDWAVGAVLLFSPECYRAVGGWDESYFLYSEETDFCLRARDLGYLTRYQPTAVAVHIGGQSGQNGWTHSMQIVNRVRLYRRRHSRAAAWLYFGATVLSELSWLVRGHRQSGQSIRALLLPRYRPEELGCGNSLLPS